MLRELSGRPAKCLALLGLLHAAALALFIHGFLLARVHLDQRSADPPWSPPGGGEPSDAGAAPPQPPYDRVVWLMIDALRYDMVVMDGRYACSPQQAVCHQGRMPFLSALARRQDAARAFMFVSDAPTTTTQRLTALATGGLPSFFDVSNSFTAGAVGDDNLVDQLAAAGKRMAFLGDTTWGQLFPRQWAWSRPYPCFNVKDLHTVDDGVWEHLLPALHSTSGSSDAGNASLPAWDGLLVAHYLGVDHCGHSHGVGSQAMADKLGQMDEHVRLVVGALLRDAGPGGAHERTLLLVSGDHGQTLGGDHGGGSPEEVDSALVAVDIGALHAAGGLAGSGGAAAGAAAAPPAACRARCECGVERNQCVPDLAQTDLTPTLAALLGVPIPFGNLGKLSSELWGLTAARGRAASTASGSAQEAWQRSLAGALLANARQVHRYLSTYAATAGASFSRAALARLEALHAAAVAPTADLAAQIVSCYAYLEAAAEVARQQWTQFNEPAMLAGLALFAAALALHAAVALRAWGDGSGAPASAAGGWLAAAAQQLVARVGRWRIPVPSLRACLMKAALAHCLGIFSFFYLLNEGKAVCGLVAAACLALALATARAVRAARQPLRKAVVLGVMALRCNALMAVLGVAHHTGQGFWARLTVHDPQPEGDVERGWHGKLDGMKAVGAMLLARAGVLRLPPAALAVGQHALLCTLPLIALALLTDRLRGGSKRSGLQRLLALAAFASVAAYQHAEDAAAHGLLPRGTSLGQLVGEHLWPLLPGDLAARAHELAAAVVAPVLTAWPAAGTLGSRLLALPLSALLPHATYAACGTAAGLWLAQVATRQLRGAATATAAAQLLLAAVLQVSDRQAPLILLLALLEVAAIARLLARRAQLLPAAAAAGVGGEAGVLLALVAPQLFYATGHLCEFAGLQYTAGFIGSDEFSLLRSASLIALNTFGGFALALLALPAVLEYAVEAAGAEAAAAAAAAKGRRSPAKRGRSKGGGGGAASPQVAALRAALLTAGLVRAAAAFCAAVSAGVQRRHLYAWALFAPRFAFEACFLAAADLLLAALAVVAA